MPKHTPLSILERRWNFDFIQWQLAGLSHTAAADLADLAVQIREDTKP